MFKKLMLRIAMRQAKKAAMSESGAYSPVTSVSKGVPAVAAALLVPVIVNLLRQAGIQINDGDALQIALYILGGGGVVWNWVKNWLVPRFAKK